MRFARLLTACAALVILNATGSGAQTTPGQANSGQSTPNQTAPDQPAAPPGKPPQPCGAYFLINPKGSATAALKDPRVRQALSMSLDRDLLAEIIARPGSSLRDVTPAYTIAPPYAYNGKPPEGLWDPDLKGRGALRAALTLLREAGVPQSPPLTLRLYVRPMSAVFRDAVTLARDWWERIGLDVSLNEVNGALYQGARRDFDYDLTFITQCGTFSAPEHFVVNPLTSKITLDNHWQILGFADEGTPEGPARKQAELRKAEVYYDQTGYLIPLVHMIYTPRS